MRVALVLLLLAAPAAADRSKCTVTIARAPEEVRPIVERWVQSEPVCDVSLEVRIVPTEGGYYIFAEDGNHRVRERLVPDAESAGVLVVSWIADDKLPSAAPAATPEIRAPGITAAIATPSEPSRRWISVTGFVGLRTVEPYGVAAAVDIATWRAFAIGVATSWLQGSLSVYASEGTGFMQFSDARGLAYGAHTARFGKWNLRSTLAAGVLYSRGTVLMPGIMDDVSGVSPAIETSLMFGREIGDSWAIAMGLLGTYTHQSYDVESPNGPRELRREQPDLMFSTSVRHRL